MKRFPLKVISTSELMEEAVDFAIAYEVSAYDAAYVALSRRVNAPLLTLEQKLFKRMRSQQFDVRSLVNFTFPLYN